MSSDASLLIFDRFVVDKARRTFLRDGRPVPLNGKTFDLLLLFAENPGSVLSREELQERLWPESNVEDGNLSQNVYLLRRALDSYRGGPSHVETLPRYGYRFRASVRRADRTAERRAWLSRSWLAAAATLAMVVGLGSSSSLRFNPSAEPAYRAAYELGLYHLALRSQIELTYARYYFRDALADAPQSADAYAGVAAADALLAEFEATGSLTQRDDVAAARRYRNAALAIDPENSQALAVSGFIAYRFEGDRRSAAAYLEEALLRDPTNAAAHHWHGVVLLLDGQLRQAMAEFETAHTLAPASEVFSRWLARTYVYAHRPDDAIHAAMDAIRLERDDAPAWIALARAQEERGELAQSLRTLRTLEKAEPDERIFLVADEARLQLRLHRGDAGRAEATIDRLAAARKVDPFEAALFFLTAGRKERAAQILRAAAPSQVDLAIERYDPRFHYRVPAPEAQ